VSAGQDDRALTLAAEYLKHRPTDARVRVLVARVYLRRGDLDGAYTELRRALADDARSIDAHYYLGLAAARLAERELERLVEVAPDSARVKQLHAEALEAQDRRSAAESAYEAALAADPQLLEPLLALARLKRIRLACEDAIDLYERAERLTPTFDGAFGLGVCYGYVGRDDAALAQFERAIERDATAAVAWAGLGSALTKLGRPADAVAKLQRAIQLEPSMHEAYYALGLAYHALGRTAESRQAFEKARQLSSEDPARPASSPPPAP
jgi:tetratricopeptide (TPR) repeat protein